MKDTSVSQKHPTSIHRESNERVPTLYIIMISPFVEVTQQQFNLGSLFVGPNFLKLNKSVINRVNGA